MRLILSKVFYCLGIFLVNQGGLFGDNADRPNIVFILVDDLGYMDLGCYGSSFYESPRIDALAEEGVRFTQAYAASPVCSPTRAAILTGKYPSRVDITDWIPGARLPDRKLLEPEDRDNLALTEVTVAEQLREFGYQTFFAGKWHLGNEGHFPEDQGFEINKGGHHKGTPPGGYYPPFNNPRLEDQPEDSYLTDRLTDESIQFLEKRDRERPFLLYLAYYTVHTPIQGCRDYDDYFRIRADGLGPAGEPIVEDDAWSRPRQDNPEYAAMVKSLDTNVGRLLDALDEKGLAKNTIIIFTSDNGGLSTSGKPGPTSLLPYRAGKGWCYEGGIRVPLIIRAPGASRAGSVTDALAISMDFFPTLLNFAGVPISPDSTLDGVDLSAALKGEALERDTLFWHYPHYHGSKWKPGAAIRVGKWKLIHSYHYQRNELYNLEEDPGERSNLAERHADLVAVLMERLTQLQKETGARLPVPREAERSPARGPQW